MPIDESSAPPRKRTPNTKSSAPGITAAGTVSKYEDGINGIFQLAAFTAVGTNNLADAGAISMHGKKISHEVAVLGAANEKVGQVLNYLTAVTPYTALFSAVLPLIAQLAVNHRVIKPEVGAAVGAISPQALEAITKKHIAEQEQAMLHEQKVAEAALAELKMQRANANGRVPEEHIPEGYHRVPEVDPGETY